MPLQDNDYNKWLYKPHTKIKHEILKKYLGPWIKILGSTRGGILYVDGFAGRGCYANGENGSPIIALEEASKASTSYNHFVAHFVEKHLENCQSLRNVLNKKQRHFAKNITFRVHNKTFVEFFDELKEIIERQSSLNPPIFFFIDPFGFSGIPFETINYIMNLPQTEVFITFMSRDINRFLDLPTLESTLNSLFGTDSWKSLSSMPNREDELVKLYQHQLRTVADIRYTWTLKVYTESKKQTLYYLIYATNHIKGLKIMKSIMYNIGGLDFTFTGSRLKQISLQDILDPKHPERALKSFFLTRFSNEKLTYDQLIERSLDETPYPEKYYRSALKELEADQVIVVDRQSSKTEKGLSRLDLMTFP